MYHYLRGSREYPCREVPSRDPHEIRDEMATIRDLLKTTESAAQEAEARHRSLLLALEERGYEDHESLRALEESVTECERTRDALEALWDLAEALSQELRDALYFLRGIVA